METKNLFAISMQEWKTSDLPIIIWGSGLLGKRVGNFLDKNNIKFSYFAINKAFYDSSASIRLNHEVVILEDYLQHNKCNIIIGFEKYSDSLLASLNTHNINKIYALDFLGRLVIGEDNLIDESFLTKNKETLEKLKENLYDLKSKDALEQFLEQKITGKFSKPYEKNTQYFDPEIINLSDNEIYIDCGAFHGETITSFCTYLKEQNLKPAKKIIALEPDRQNAQITKEQLKEIDNIEMIEAGLWNSVGELCFDGDRRSNSRIDVMGKTKIRVETIDNLIGDTGVTFIKMDIEVSELNALKGGAASIKKFKPKLAVCVYHRPEDLITIPQYIKQLNPSYKLFFRNYHQNGIEAVLYAI